MKDFLKTLNVGVTTRDSDCVCSSDSILCLKSDLCSMKRKNEKKSKPIILDIDMKSITSCQEIVWIIGGSWIIRGKKSCVHQSV